MDDGREEGGGATCPDFGKACAPAEPKSRPMTRAKFFIEKKTPKTCKNDLNLLIFLPDLEKYHFLPGGGPLEIFQVL